jgi:hypothetical protein
MRNEVFRVRELRPALLSLPPRARGAPPARVAGPKAGSTRRAASAHASPFPPPPKVVDTSSAPWRVMHLNVPAADVLGGRDPSFWLTIRFGWWWGFRGCE